MAVFPFIAQKLLFKNLSFSLLFVALCMFYGCDAAPAMAADTPPVPTIDRLNQQGLTAAQSAYTYEPAQQGDKNTVTIYESHDSKVYYDYTKDENGNIEYKQVAAPTETSREYASKVTDSAVFSVDLKQNTYGADEGYGEVKYYKWQQNGNINTLVETDASDADLIYRVDNTRQPINAPITTGNSGVDIEGNFINVGQAVDLPSAAVIGSVVGDFVDNSTSYSQITSSFGNIKLNGATTGDFTGDFVNNSLTVTNTGTSSILARGPLFSADNSTIGNVTGDFINNSISAATENSAANIRGGVIYLANSTIGNITGDFIGNSIKAESTANNATGNGGAIWISNNGSADITVGDITGNFIGNSVTAKAEQNATATNGAIYMNLKTAPKNITGDFIGNSVYAEGKARADASSGALGLDINGIEINSVNGDFIGNSAVAYSDNGQATAQMGAFNVSTFSTINAINSNFIGNYVVVEKGNSSSYASGGALYNDFGSTIGTLNGNFIGNYSYAKNGFARAGALFATSGSVINKLNGSFYYNYAKSDDSYAQGGAISIGNGNTTFNEINGDFIGNYAEGKTGAYGGAIADWVGNYETLNSNFINNYAYGIDGGATGGAFRLYGASLGTINGNFINNYARGTYAQGGALSNQRNDSKGTINSNFLGNQAIADNGFAEGGAIHIVASGGLSGEFNGDFILNSAIAKSETDDYAHGGAISALSVLGNVNGDFLGNYAEITSQAGAEALGGAIYSTSYKIGNLDSDFIANHVSADARTNALAAGGAYYNNGGSSSGLIKGDFISNYAQATGKESAQALGGAMYSYGAAYSDRTVSQPAEFNKLSDINFVNNTASATSEGEALAAGGALYISDDGGFIRKQTITLQDSAQDPSKTYSVIGYSASGAYGGYNMTLDKTTFYQNTAKSTGDAKGGALYAALADNEYTEHNSVYTPQDVSDNIGDGSAITYDEAKDILDEYFNESLNSGYIYKTQEEAEANISNGYSSTLSLNETAFENNSAVAQNGNALGGAVYTNQYLTDVNAGSFVNNAAVTTAGNAFGGAVYNEASVNLPAAGTLQFGYGLVNVVDDSGNTLVSFYTIMEAESYYPVSYDEFKELVLDGTVTELEFMGEQNTNIAQTGMTLDEIKDMIAQEGYPQEDPNIFFEENKVEPKPIDTIRNMSALTFKNTSFIGNYADSENGEAKGGAIYSKGNVKIAADNGSTTLISGNYTKNGDKIEQNAIYMDNAALILDSTNKSTIQIDDKISGDSYDMYLIGDKDSKIVLNNSVSNANITLDTTNVYVTEGKNLENNRSLVLNSGNLYINHLDNMSLNFDKISNAGNIDLGTVDVDLAAETMGRLSADSYGESTGNIYVRNFNLLTNTDKNYVAIGFADKPIAQNVSYTGANPVAYSPIYKYDVDYIINPQDSMGYFTFSRGSGSSVNTYNPAVLAPSVATQVGAYTTQLQTFNYAFQHADTFMNIPYLERLSIINSGRYALSPTGDATDVGTFSPLLTKEEDPGFWVKPYASFENIPLKNGPKVSNINYGTLVGYDSPLTSVGNGFERVLTGYIGYNGASQRYSGVDAYQNGGLLGGTATFYKGNFFNATTLSVGASAGDASTMYGSENYTMLLAGLGNKTGYNFEFFDGGMILQPSMLISYTFVNTFDYHNAAGVHIESDPMHAIQLAPGIKLIGNTKNGWQPYIGVSMVWNLLDESKVTADSVRLPEMSIKPYVQYGVGIQKRFKDKFLAFGQAMIHNGGRNGVSLSGGLRWKVGK